MDSAFYNINLLATSFYEQHVHECTDWCNYICTIYEIKKLQQLETRNNTRKQQQSILTRRVLATLQPRVPAPSRRHFVLTTLSRSREGTSRHLMSFRFRSTDDSASLQTVNEDKREHSLFTRCYHSTVTTVVRWRKMTLFSVVDIEALVQVYSINYLLGSMHSLRLTILGPMAPLGFFSQPTLFGHANGEKNSVKYPCCKFSPLFHLHSSLKP